MLDMLEDFLAFRSIPYARLDGSTNRPRRTLDIKLVSMTLHLPIICPLICYLLFSSSKSNLVRNFYLKLNVFLTCIAVAYKVFLISTKAGGLGMSTDTPFCGSLLILAQVSTSPKPLT
jgi:SNF2 family DNA or RNA helicase